MTCVTSVALKMIWLTRPSATLLLHSVAPRFGTCGTQPGYVSIRHVSVPTAPGPVSAVPVLDLVLPSPFQSRPCLTLTPWHVQTERRLDRQTVADTTIRSVLTPCSLTLWAVHRTGIRRPKSSRAGHRKPASQAARRSASQRDGDRTARPESPGSPGRARRWLPGSGRPQDDHPSSPAPFRD